MSRLSPSHLSTVAPTLAKEKEPQNFLVIGYGNPLHGDDAAGIQVATMVAGWQLPTVRTLTRPQLMPELVKDLVAVDYVIFVDACRRNSIRSVQIEPITGDKRLEKGASQTCSPWHLLQLAESRYGYRPQAWLIEVPVECFDPGGQLSPTTQQGCDRVLRSIENFLNTYQPPPLPQTCKTSS